MTNSEVDLSAPELSPEDVLQIDDEHFRPDTVAIVTGAASGIGRATAIALGTNGLTVVGADIDEDGLEETADRVESFGLDGRFVPVPTDLTDDADVEAANLFVFGFSSHARHLNGGDLLFDGGNTSTYE